MPSSLEFQFLEQICLQHLKRQPSAVLADLAANKNFSWGELLEQGARHRLLPAVSHALETQSIWKYSPKKVREALNDLRNTARQRAIVFQRTTRSIASAFESAGITYCVRKGLVTQNVLYEVPYLRIFSDLDFLVRPDDASQVRKVLKELAFTEGHFEHASDSVMPLPREEAIRLRLNPDHLPRFSMRTDDEVIRHTEVDVATSLTWTNSGYEVSVDHALAQKRPIESGPLAGIQRLDDAFLFLDSILHLFREAYLEITIAQTGEDVNLSKFLEVALLWDRLLRDKHVQDKFITIIEESSVRGPVGWVAYHTDSLFETTILKDLGLEQEVNSMFLNSWRASGGKVGQWTGTMRQRLATKNRLEMFQINT